MFIFRIANNSINNFFNCFISNELIQLMNDPKTYKIHLYVFDYIRLNKYTIPNDLPQLNFHELCSQNSRNAFMYAYNILKRSFPLGEPVISQNAQYACSYARYVLHRRFELGEPVIATDARSSYDYARFVCNGRFELGEAIIRSNSSLAYEYDEMLHLKNNFGIEPNTQLF